MERQISFIIEQQAKFTVDIAEEKDQIAELREQVGEVTASVKSLTNHVARLTDATLSLTQIERHDGQIGELTAFGKDTDARLNVLITTVERFISGANPN